MKKQSTKKRSLYKTITWRITATTTTILATWLVTGELLVGLAVGGIEGSAKLFLYYFHEEAWHKWG